MHWTVLMAWVKKYVASAMEAIDLSAYMKKGVDYVTAGQRQGVPIGFKATAEGDNTAAVGSGSHAEGWGCSALGNYAHAEGNGAGAYGNTSHAEGTETSADGVCSHVEGYGSQAVKKSQHVFGEYNVAETGSTAARGSYVEIVGNGTAENSRSNARTLDWSGNEWLAGMLKVGGTSYADAVEVVAVNPPATDGTYVLKAVVTSGVATYSWVAE